MGKKTEDCCHTALVAVVGEVGVITHAFHNPRKNVYDDLWSVIICQLLRNVETAQQSEHQIVMHIYDRYTLPHVWRIMYDIYVHGRYTLHAACMYGAWCMIYTYMTNIHSMQHVWRIMYDRHVQQYLPNWLKDMAVTQYICVTTTLSNNRQRLRMYVHIVQYILQCYNYPFQ